MADYPHADLTRAIIGTAFHVHRTFGFGFLEAVYKRAMVIELAHQRIPSLREVRFEIEHRGEWCGTYVADLVVHQRVIVEVKTGLIPDPVGPQLTLNYLRASALTVGLYIHFGPRLSFRRVVYSNRRDEIPRVTRF